MTIWYDGRRFRVAGVDGAVPAAQYHQQGDLVWAEFAGGKVRRGSLAGTCAQDGVLRLAYCMVLDTGDLVTGRCVSTPTLLDDGRVRLSEEWERFSPLPATGTSLLEETR
ncbi:MAG: hypothetical protein GEV12_08965 [Micromonosporaceae bacterium]|nr:hypothetical protein [Micromonosporaceae bacterium]